MQLIKDVNEDDYFYNLKRIQSIKSQLFVNKT